MCPQPGYDRDKLGTTHSGTTPYSSSGAIRRIYPNLCGQFNRIVVDANCILIRTGVYIRQGKYINFKTVVSQAQSGTKRIPHKMSPDAGTAGIETGV
jgi:hypothetical protein